MLTRLAQLMGLKSLPAVNPAGEGNYHPGPYHVNGGWIPSGSPWNFWQCDIDPVPGGSNATVEACVWAYIRAIAQLPGYHQRDKANGGTEQVTSSALARLLINPNWYQTSSDFMTHLVRSLLLSGIAVTAKEMEAAMHRHAGNRKIGKVTWQHDPAIQKICDGWPQGIDSRRARSLGFETDRDLDEVVRNFIADDLDEQMKIAKAA